MVQFVNCHTKTPSVIRVTLPKPRSPASGAAGPPAPIRSETPTPEQLESRKAVLNHVQGSQEPMKADVSLAMGDWKRVTHRAARSRGGRDGAQASIYQRRAHAHSERRRRPASTHWRWMGSWSAGSIHAWRVMAGSALTFF